MSHPLEKCERTAEQGIKDAAHFGFVTPVLINPHSLAMLCRIVRLAIAADEFSLMSNAKQMALRDALREEGLRQC